jgi:hypothetical protein
MRHRARRDFGAIHQVGDRELQVEDLPRVAALTLGLLLQGLVRSGLGVGGIGPRPGPEAGLPGLGPMPGQEPVHERHGGRDGALEGSGPSALSKPIRGPLRGSREGSAAQAFAGLPVAIAIEVAVALAQ